VTRTKFAVLGGGAWGLALAKLLSENGHQVGVWEFNPEFVKLLQKTHANPHLLKGVTLPPDITFSNNFTDILTPDTQHIIVAIPSQFLRETVRKASPVICGLQHLQSVISVVKGIEQVTHKRMSEVLQEELPCELCSEMACLSGPSHAEEVARQVPTVVVIAGKDNALLQKLQGLFSNPWFRMYRSEDMIGVEIGGAVKNIIAIAAGIIDGLEMGDNTKGALIARGVVEIQRLGVALGARPETFLGLSGIGDLYATASSKYSRNRFVGNEIGKGRKLADILAGMQAVAEGVASTRSVLELSRQSGVEMPITEQINEVLFNHKSPRQAITDLMTRSLKSE
jgi:glycerol-3-phosphate dehydrogenase (NAD(P)+)